jgi:hypothetical protein
MKSFCPNMPSIMDRTGNRREITEYFTSSGGPQCRRDCVYQLPPTVDVRQINTRPKGISSANGQSGGGAFGRTIHVLKMELEKKEDPAW